MRNSAILPDAYFLSLNPSAIKKAHIPLRLNRLAAQRKFKSKCGNIYHFIIFHIGEGAAKGTSPPTAEIIARQTLTISIEAKNTGEAFAFLQFTPVWLPK